MGRFPAITGLVLCLAAALPAAAKKKEKKSNPAAVALFKKALAVSDIEAKGSPAFRLQATVRAFGAGSQNMDGKILKFWTPEGKWREETFLRSYEFVVVSDGRHEWVKSTMNYLPYRIDELWKALAFPNRLRWWLDPAANPLWAAGTLERTLLPHEKVHLGKPKNGKKRGEECVRAKLSDGYKEDYCFDRSTGHLLSLVRVQDFDPANYEYSDYAVFDGKSFPTTVRVTGGKNGQVIVVHVDGIKPMANPPAATFLPVQGSQEEPLVSACEKLTMAMPVKIIQPKETITKEVEQAGGLVTFYGYIGTDGVIRGLAPLRLGTPTLTFLASQAVKQWRYSPAICASGGVAEPMPQAAYPPVFFNP